MEEKGRENGIGMVPNVVWEATKLLLMFPSFFPSFLPSPPRFLHLLFHTVFSRVPRPFLLLFLPPPPLKWPLGEPFSPPSPSFFLPLYLPTFASRVICKGRRREVRAGGEQPKMLRYRKRKEGKPNLSTHFWGGSFTHSGCS